jgi:hypothetical protein
MAAGAVRVRGLRELQRDFRKMGGILPRETKEALRKSAEPVRAEAQSLFSPISAESAAGYRVAVRARGVAVEQRKGRTTGQHPEFGALQMRRALLPALELRRDDVIDGLDQMLGRLAGENGF